MRKRSRAVNPEQKIERRQAILDTAWSLFQTSSYEAVTINAVAEQLQLAKGTVYLYFQTKEELFLAIEQQQLEEWFDDVDSRLPKLRGRGTTDQVTNLIGRSLEKRQGFTRLLAILHTVIEQNIDYEAALQFKRQLKTHLLTTGALLEACLPFLKLGQGAQLLLRIDALVIGLQHESDPAPLIQQVLQEPELALFRINFAREFAATLGDLLRGMENPA
jgi:AcrR family transcriptional regulator